VPRCLATLSAIQSRRSWLGPDAGHARVCRPQPLVMHLIASSPTSWCGLKPVILQLPARPRCLRGPPTGRHKIRHPDDHDETRASQAPPVPRPWGLNLSRQAPVAGPSLLSRRPKKPNCLLLIRQVARDECRSHVSGKVSRTTHPSEPVASSNVACRR
jgi:hypothetical protein